MLKLVTLVDVIIDDNDSFPILVHKKTNNNNNNNNYIKKIHYLILMICI